MKSLILFSHPKPEKSLANKTILTALSEAAEVRTLIELYPEYRIDVKAEQKALLRADLIILQFPFYWYSVPAILKLWLDEVFEYGFAYGSSGDKLKGKKLLLSFTTGGPGEAYSKDGYNHYEIEELLAPLIQTANLAGMVFLPPIYTHSMVFAPGLREKEEIEARALEHAKKLLTVITEH